MRHNRSAFRVLTFIAAVSVLAACGAKEEAPMDEAPAAAAAPPTPDSYTLMAKDGSWSADITPSAIVVHHKRNDSLTFEFKAPTVDGALSSYESLYMGNDTTRVTISMAMAPCTDSKGNTYTHMVQLWLTGSNTLTGEGCATKK